MGYFCQGMQRCCTEARPSTASLPGGEMETMPTIKLEGLRTRAQIGGEKKLTQVFKKTTCDKMWMVLFKISLSCLLGL